ncbi:hypothetical protein NPIL_360831 [Nephila pilipes]|uniref:Uncharacterized protein n=1 Tax=Nephila pilipes TaxID=299642 RepID=A0A8X6Q1I6_NEPPI|nr:hypothetical protein NPIL_360831 [Nephila pilipes]
MNIQWKHTLSPPPEQSKAILAATKVMSTSLFNYHWPFLIDLLQQKFTINSALNCRILMIFRKAIKTKRPSLLSQKVIFLHNSIRALSSRYDHTKKIGSVGTPNIQPGFVAV